MSSAPTRVAAFLAELKRRRVYQVAAVYAAAAFVAAQAAEILLPRLGMPDWTVTLVVVVAVAGFPMALILGWAFAITPSGVRRTEPAPEGASPLPLEPWRVAGGTAAAVVVLIAGGWWLSSFAFRPAAPTIERLAVLPFGNLTNDPEQEHFVYGMHDALISELAQAGIGVIARTSVMPYENVRRSVREIARELNVGALIEGSVLRDGERVRIQVQLIDAATEANLWARRYDAELRDVLALHRRVTREVAREIGAVLTPPARARLAAAARPVDPAAYEAYLRGRFHWFKLTPEDVEAAHRNFELALQKDPEYALAYVGLAQYSVGRAAVSLEPPGEAWPKAKAAARRALDLDPTVGEAHDILAWALTWYEYDWTAAEQEFRRAVELNPDHAHGRSFYGLFLHSLGRGSGYGQGTPDPHPDPGEGRGAGPADGDGTWTHDYPITLSKAEELGLNVSSRMPGPVSAADAAPAQRGLPACSPSL